MADAPLDGTSARGYTLAGCARQHRRGPLVFVSRWGLTPIAPVINLVVGAQGFPFRRFILWDASGEALWVARVALPAFALGTSAGVASVPLALVATLLVGAVITLSARRLTQGNENPGEVH